MTVVTPERSLAQRLSALDRANVIRCYRAELKRDLKRGHTRAGERITIRAVLDRRDDELVASMKLIELLLAMPSVGRVKANKVLVRARISPSKTLGGLTERQTAEVLVELGNYPSSLR
jgi:hypothetical protein